MKKYFITGLLVWVPLGITLWVLDLTIGTMDQTLLLLPEAWHPDRLLGIHIPGWGIILTLLIGLAAGWLAGTLTKGQGFGLLGNLIVGVLGALLGSFVFGLIGITAWGPIGRLVLATAGAVLLLFLLRFVRKS